MTQPNKHHNRFTQTETEPKSVDGVATPARRDPNQLRLSSLLDAVASPHRRKFGESANPHTHGPRRVATLRCLGTPVDYLRPSDSVVPSVPSAPERSRPVPHSPTRASGVTPNPGPQPSSATAGPSSAAAGASSTATGPSSATTGISAVSSSASAGVPPSSAATGIAAVPSSASTGVPPRCCLTGERAKAAHGRQIRPPCIIA